MIKQAKFIYDIGSEVYVHKSVFIQLRVKTRSCTSKCSPIIESIYNGGILYSDLPDLIKVKVLGHSVSISHTGLKSYFYMCSCEYSDMVVYIDHLKVFNSDMLGEFKSQLDDLNKLYTEESVAHMVTSYLKRLVRKQISDADSAIVYNIDIPTHIPSKSIILPKCKIYDGFEPNLENELIYSYSLDITNDSINSLITVRFNVNGTNCFIDIAVTPKSSGLDINLRDFKDGRVISARTFKSKSKIFFN